MKILIADDDSSSLSKITAILEEMGACTAVESGTDAVKTFGDALSKAEPFDLVTLDIDMPDLDGIKVLQKIRMMEEEKKIPKSNRSRIIMVSGKSDKNTLITCLKAGCDSFIVKPFNITTLIEKMEKIETKDGRKPFILPKSFTEHYTENRKYEEPPLIMDDSPIKGKRLRILIVDDDDISRQKMETILEGLGDCTAAKSGQEAITFFQTALKQGKFFHLITMDYSMPEMSGVETVSQIRKIESVEKISSGNCAKVIMVTGHSDKENVITSLQAGCNEYVVKPFNQGTIFQRLTKLKLIDSQS
jgi:two-component system, chemotaxis family, chemotaxis protein CheY